MRRNKPPTEAAAGVRRSSVLRLVLINGLILIGAWFVVLIVILAVSDIRRGADRSSRSPDDAQATQALLPNQPDQALALRIAADLRAGSHTYVPFVEWRHKPQSSPTLHITAEGLRGPSAGTDIRPGTKPIGFFGGSAMWGIGVADDDTIPARFGALGSGFAVTNYGEIAWTSRQSVEQLINLINQNRMPKIVVFYDGYNDVAFLCDLAMTESLNGTAREKNMRARISGHERRDGLMTNLVSPIVDLAIKVNRSEAGTNQFVCAKDRVRAEQVAETLVRNWEIARTLVEANGGRFFAFLQPNAFIGHPRTDYMPDAVGETWRDRRLAAPEFAAVYPLIQAKLAARASAWAADATNAFDGDEMLYIDSVHVVGKGNAIMAKRMFDTIARATQQAAN